MFYIKSRLRKATALSWYFFDYLKNRSRIILIYQLGKVGSSTIYASLKTALPLNEIYQVHFLSNYWLKEKLPSLDEYFHKNIEIGNNILEKIKANPRKRIKIITLVREPIEREISDIFENWEPRYGRVCADNIDLKKILDDFKKNDFSYTLSWYDSEFYNYTGVDIFSLKFDQEQGYSIYNLPEFDILCIKLEKLNQCYKDAFEKFLGLKLTKLSYWNLADDKKNFKRYKEVKRYLKLDKEFLEKVYKTKYVSHFYSDKEITEFTMKWS